MKLKFVNKKFLDKNGHIAQLEITNPTKHNALSSDLLKELTLTFKTLEKATNVKVIILSAKRNSPVWSAGYDLDELKVKGFDPMAKSSAYKQFITLLKNYTKPVVVSIDGTVWGGAVEIVFLCDIIIATPQTKFYLTALKVGFPYDVEGIINLVSILGDKVFREMFFTANGLSSLRLHRLGVVNYLVNRKNLARQTQLIATAIEKNYGEPMCLVKRQLSLLNRKQLPPTDMKIIESLRKDILQRKK